MSTQDLYFFCPMIIALMVFLCFQAIKGLITGKILIPRSGGYYLRSKEPYLFWLTIMVWCLVSSLSLWLLADTFLRYGKLANNGTFSTVVHFFGSGTMADFLIGALFIVWLLIVATTFFRPFTTYMPDQEEMVEEERVDENAAQRKFKLFACLIVFVVLFRALRYFIIR